MIFVTVGASLSFDRLIEYIDREIAPALDEKIIAQIHDSSRYIPKNIEYIKSENKKSFDEHIKRADLVIAHAGIGIIMDCIKYNKKLIIIPRDPSKGELIDSHQYEICRYLEEEKRAINIVYDFNELYNKILNNLHSSPLLFEDSKKNLKKLKTNISMYLSKNYFQGSNIFIVCSSGGHLRQMLDLLEIFPKDKILLITNSSKIELESVKTQIIKGDFTDKFLYIRSCCKAVFLIFRYRPSLIFTNGGGELSIPFSFFGKLFRCKIIFMETISRVKTKSKAAQLIYPIADIFLIQWEKNLSKYGKKAKYWGSVI